MKRRLFTASLVASMPATHALRASAQDRYPSKPIRIVVPFAAGGSADAIMRIVADAMQARLNQPLVIDNRPGAGGNIGTEMVARGTPDGYTLLLGGAPNMAINPGLYEKVPFDSEKDFSAIALLVSAPNLIVVHPAIPVKSLKELIAYAKTVPGGLPYTSAGVGGTGHLTGEMLSAVSQVPLLHVADKNPLVSVMGGHVPMCIYTPAATLPQVRAGKLRAISVTSRERMSIAPEVPTIAEAGYAGFEAVAWYGIVAPRGVPADIRKVLSEAAASALQDKLVKEKLAALACETHFMNDTDFSRFISTEKEKWAAAIKRSGAKAI